MKRKIIIVLIMIVLIICNCLITKVNAEGENICTIDANLSKNSVKPGEEFELSIYTTQIKEPIAGIGFSINYDNSIIEFVELKNVNGWTMSKTENLVTIFTSNYEATTTTGIIGEITFKVKNDVTETKVDVSLTAIQVTKNDTTTSNLNEITKSLILEQTTPENGNNQNEKDSTIESKTNADENNQNNNKNTVKEEKTKAEDSTKKNNLSLPYTGYFAIKWSTLAIMIIIIVISYTKYRKYKKI